jgi:hypothetical protein
MPIVETVFVVGMMCASTTRNRAVEEQQPTYTVSNGLSVVLFQVSSGRTLGGKVREEFSEVSGVGDVAIGQNGQTVSVGVEMLSFDRATRRRVYAKERKLCRDFPNHTFNVYLIDQSQRIADAHEG